MYQVVYASDFTTYIAGVYADVETWRRDCVARYGARVTFGQDDAGHWYTVLWDEGIVTLTLYEMESVGAG